MNHDDHENLDEQLKNWAMRHAASVEDLKLLEASLSVRLESRPAITRRPETFAVTTVAACLLLLAIGLRPQSSSIPRYAAVERLQRHVAHLWSETDEVFEGRLAWICELDGELLFGLQESVQNTAAEPVCALLEVRRFDQRRQRWVTVWVGRMRCAGGTTLDYAASDDRSSGSLWIQPLADGSYSVSHWLTWRDYPELSGPVEGTIAPDAAQIVADRVLPDGQRVQLVQQVWRPEPHPVSALKGGAT